MTVQTINNQLPGTGELDDELLDKVSGGINIPTLSHNGNPIGLNLGQALEKPSCFSKSDDHLPSNDPLL